MQLYTDVSHNYASQPSTDWSTSHTFDKQPSTQAPGLHGVETAGAFVCDTSWSLKPKIELDAAPKGNRMLQVSPFELFLHFLALFYRIGGGQFTSPELIGHNGAEEIVAHVCRT